MAQSRLWPRSRCESTVVPRQVGARSGHECDQAFDQLVRREPEGCGAVAPGPFELEFDPAVLELGKAVGGDRRAGQVSGHALEPISVVGGDPRGGLQVVALDLRAQPPHDEGVDVGGDAADTDDAL